jgi:hypothetical protein
VATKGSEETKYFLVDYITDGDTYASNAFAKHAHTTPAGGQSIANYYKALCEEEIVKAIANNPSASYSLFENNLSMLGIPLFMIAGAGYTVEGIDQITFNETTFNATKKNLAQEAAWEAADETARKYGYKVTLPVTGLTITQI